MMKLTDKQIGNLDAKSIHIINLSAKNARLKAMLGACLDCLEQVEWVRCHAGTGLRQLHPPFYYLAQFL